MIKYSVIVPVYNSEKTIARCLKSLTLQHRNDVQIIVVNDGSVDSSDGIIREFAQCNSQILYITKENAGVSQARNAGLDAARGKYVTFVDSDDYVSADYFEVLDRAEDCDLLVFAHNTVGGAPLDETVLFTDLQKAESFDDRMALLLASRKIMPPWNKRFLLEQINRIRLRFLPDMHIGEDFNFCMAYAVNCRSVSVSDSCLLWVDISDPTSLSRKYRPHLAYQMQDVFLHIGETIRNSALQEEQKSRLLAITDYLFVKNVFSCISEEFKQRTPSYWKNRKQIIAICNTFRQSFSDRRVNLVHRILRFALAWKICYPFYLVSYWAKAAIEPCWSGRSGI